MNIAMLNRKTKVAAAASYIYHLHEVRKSEQFSRQPYASEIEDAANLADNVPL
jgi:hypothetical protein